MPGTMVDVAQHRGLHTNTFPLKLDRMPCTAAHLRRSSLSFLLLSYWRVLETRKPAMNVVPLPSARVGSRKATSRPAQAHRAMNVRCQAASTSSTEVGRDGCGSARETCVRTGCAPSAPTRAFSRGGPGCLAAPFKFTRIDCIRQCR